MRPLRILQICAEFVPLAKVGGLGDVTAGLSAYLSGQGHEVIVVLPRYGCLPEELRFAHRPSLSARTLRYPGGELRYSGYRVSDPVGGATVHVIDCPECFDRGDIYAPGEMEATGFMLLSQAALELCEEIGFAPDIVHCHDWHTAPAVVLLRAALGPKRALGLAHSVLTIHNIGYQGIFPSPRLEMGAYDTLKGAFSAAVTPATTLTTGVGTVNFLRAGIRHADALTTVSPTHALEIQGSEYGMGLEVLLRQRRHRLTGILNGVDYSHWDPEHDPLIEARYSRQDFSGKAKNRDALAASCDLDLDSTMPLAGFVSRLAEQKGIDLLLEALPALLRERRFGCVFLGNGDAHYVAGLTELVAEFPGRAAFLQGHDEHLAHRILAGSDLLLVPSLYEPCGLTQMYALRYGTVPVVRHTGGLADTIRHFDPATGQGNGSVFRDANVPGFTWGLSTALDWFAAPSLWRRLIENGMREDFSWQRQGPHYEKLFERLAATDRAV